jgi:hypothetical protein
MNGLLGMLDLTLDARLERVPFLLRTVVEDCVKPQAAKANEKRIALEFVGLEGPDKPYWAIPCGCAKLSTICFPTR